MQFGNLLKDWRGQRRMSQLELGLCANVSARHISFLETGRSKPSRSMVLQLCEELEVPKEARNLLLTAAGLAPAYNNRSLTEADMIPAKQALDWTLERHDPFPAMAMDRHWNIIKLNRSAKMLLAGFGIGEGDSALEVFLNDEGVAKAMLNYDEVGLHTIARLRTESAHYGGDDVLDDAAAQISERIAEHKLEVPLVLPAFVPTRFKIGEMELSIFSTFTTFGSANDIALSEITIEMMFPADEATRKMFLSMEA